MVYHLYYHWNKVSLTSKGHTGERPTLSEDYRSALQEKKPWWYVRSVLETMCGYEEARSRRLKFQQLAQMEGFRFVQRLALLGCVK